MPHACLYNKRSVKIVIICRLSTNKNCVDIIRRRLYTRMKVNPVTKNSYETSSCKNNVSVQHPCMNNQLAKDTVAFKGGLANGVKDAASGFFHTIGKNFFIEFLMVDTFSMIIPRVWIGLGRDKEKTGKTNYKAGAEEAGREVLSGPSMGLIPMGCLAAATHFAPASHMQADTLSAITEKMNKAVDSIADAKSFETKEALNKKLAGELFEDAFNDEKFKFHADDAKNIEIRNGFKDKFSSLLDESSKLNSGMFKDKAYKANAAEFEKLVAEIHNSNTVASPLNTKNIGLSYIVKEGEKDVSKATNLTAKDLALDFHNYSKDVVEKVFKKGFAQSAIETGKKEASEMITKMKTSRAGIKQATVIGAFLSVGIFLLNLPKLYQQSGLSPAEESAKRAQAEAAAQGGANASK